MQRLRDLSLRRPLLSATAQHHVCECPLISETLQLLVAAGLLVTEQEENVRIGQPHDGLLRELHGTLLASFRAQRV